jgi:hypothetical protein
MRRSRVVFLLLGIALAVPSLSRATTNHGVGVLTNSDAFIVGAVDAGPYQHRLIAWKDADEFEGVRLIVMRIGDRPDSRRVVEDTMLDSGALQLTNNSGHYIIHLEGALPTMGDFDITLDGIGPTREAWNGEWASSGISTSAIWTKRASFYAPTGNMASGIPTGLEWVLWGRQATGMVRFVNELEALRPPHIP